MGILRSLFFVLAMVFVSTGAVFSQWTTMDNPSGGGYTRVQCFAGDATNLFAGTLGGGVFLSTDNGSNWTPVNNGLTNKNVAYLHKNGTDLLAATGNGLFLTTDNGTAWDSVNSGLTNSNITSVTGIGSKLFASTFGGGVFLSTDNGGNWVTANAGLPTTSVSSLAVLGSNLFAGTYAAGVFVSTDEGANWDTAGTELTNSSVTSFAVSGTNLFAVAGSLPSTTVLLSTNNGISWDSANTGLPSTNETWLAVSGPNVFAGTYGSGFYLTTDNGTSWNAVNEGYGTTPIRSLAVIGTNLFAGIYDGGVRRRPVSDMVTSVREVPAELPAHFALSQNYPNPFNPATTIQFAIPVEGHVTLAVFDALGREIAELVSGPMNRGTYLAEWDASGFASGLYYYRLQAGSFSEMKKLILMR